jgi:hypothetical protein
MRIYEKSKTLIYYKKIIFLLNNPLNLNSYFLLSLVYNLLSLRFFNTIFIEIENNLNYFNF